MAYSDYVSILTSVVQIAVGVLLLRRHSPLKVFSAFLFVTAVRTICLEWIGPPSRQNLLYTKVWSYSQYGISALHWAMATEAYRISTRRYPNLGAIGSIVYVVGAIVAFGVSLSPFGPELVALRTNIADPIIRGGFVIRRVVALAIPLFLILTIRGFSRISLPQPANLIRHQRFMLAFFGAMAIEQLTINLFVDARMANAMFLSFALVLFAVWGFALRYRADDIAPEFQSTQTTEQAERRAEELLSWIGFFKTR